MSADNWAHCPSCAAIRTKNHVKAVAELRAAYGKVSAEQYEEMRYKIDFESKKQPSSHEQMTLREDFSIGMNSDGVVEIEYSASCRICKFQTKFKESKSLREW